MEIRTAPIYFDRSRHGGLHLTNGPEQLIVTVWSRQEIDLTRLEFTPDPVEVSSP